MHYGVLASQYHAIMTLWQCNIKASRDYDIIDLRYLFIVGRLIWLSMPPPLPPPTCSVRSMGHSTHSPSLLAPFFHFSSVASLLLWFLEKSQDLVSRSQISRHMEFMSVSPGELLTKKVNESSRRNTVTTPLTARLEDWSGCNRLRSCLMLALKPWVRKRLTQQWQKWEILPKNVSERG